MNKNNLLKNTIGFIILFNNHYYIIKKINENEFLLIDSKCYDPNIAIPTCIKGNYDNLIKHFEYILNINNNEIYIIKRIH